MAGSDCATRLGSIERWEPWVALSGFALRATPGHFLFKRSLKRKWRAERDSITPSAAAYGCGRGGRREGGWTAYSHPLVTVGRRARTPATNPDAHNRSARATRSHQHQDPSWCGGEVGGAPKGTRTRREAAAHGSGRGADVWRRPRAIRWFRRDAAPLRTTNPRGHCRTAPQRAQVSTAMQVGRARK
jgi:hypothetical protein